MIFVSVGLFRVFMISGRPMTKYGLKTSVCVFILAMSALLTGCDGNAKKNIDPALEKPAQLDATIGSLAVLREYGATPVIGHGIVAGLAGTGSSQCDPALRTMLTKYMLQQMPDLTDFNPNDFINSKDTAVVEIYGIIPSLASKGQRFDLRVHTMFGSQTTSLAGGTLYTADMKDLSRFLAFNTRARFSVYLRHIATSAGPIFIDRTGNTSSIDENAGYILAGGTVRDNVQIAITLLNPNYHTASAVRNRLNERFGPGTANAVSPDEILLQIPPKYAHQKSRFLALVSALYITNNEQLQRQRIKALVEDLRNARQVQVAATALEAVGKTVADDVAGLLNADRQSVRFHVARCLLNLGDDRGLWVLREIVTDINSEYRMPAIEAIGYSASRRDAIATLTDLLTEKSLEVKLAAYEHLRRLEDVSVSTTLTDSGFMVDRVACPGPKMIYTQRKDSPRIVLFGDPIRCEKNFFVNLPDLGIIINAQEGERFVSMLRKFPNRPRPIGPIKSTFKVSDVIRTLCADPDVGSNVRKRPGLGASYGVTATILEHMCKIGAISANFKSGPLPQIELPDGFMQ